MRRFFLVLLVTVACGDGTGPSHEDALRDVIVFRRITGPNTGQLYMVHPDGTGLQPILTGTGKVQGSPAVSRDGRIVAYTDTTCRVWLQDYPSGAPVEAFRVESCPFGPRWSTDGRLAATRDANLILMDTVGGTPLTVLDDEFNNSLLDWHPTEDRMAYTSERNGAWAIYSLDVASGEASLLFDTPGTERAPRWSPDGRRVSYEVTGIPSDTLVLGLWIFDLDTDADSLLVPNVDCPCPWSPDGRFLLFSQGGEGPPGSFVRLELTTGEQVPIVTRPAGIIDVQPDWAW